MSCKQNQDLIDAYIDGELDLLRSLEIEQHLKDCSACGHAYERRRTLITALKAAPLAYEVPAQLERTVRLKLRREAPTESPLERPLDHRVGRWRGWLYGLASAAALAFVLVSGVPGLQGPWGEAGVGREVVAAHVRSLMADHLTDIRNSNHHVVKPWFNGRLDFSPPVRDFSDHGFPLTGGRLDYLNGRHVAAIVYYRAAHPINLFVWPTAPGDPRREKTSTEQGYHLIRWPQGGMTYWVISDLNEHDLKDFVELLKSPSS